MDNSDDKSSSIAKLAIEHHQRPTGPHRSRAIVIIVLVVAAMTIGAGWWYYQTTGKNVIAAVSTRPTAVNLLVVDQAPAAQGTVALVANGKIVSDLQVKIATKVSGQIVELLVEQGDRVVEDQVLAKVEDVIYRAQRDEASAVVQRRESEVQQARSEHAKAQATVLEQQARYEFELRNYERLQRLRDNGQVDDFEFFNSKNDAEAAKATLDAAVAGERSAKTAIAAAQADLEAAQASLVLLQKRFDDCTIRTPIAGVVLERNAQVGDFLAAEGGRGANANAQLVEVADMTRLRVEVDVSERDVHRLVTGQRARVTPDADRNSAYGGEILWIDPIGDYAKATVQAKVRILEPGPNLRVGGSAKVEFLSSESKKADAAERQWLPKTAVQLTPGSNEALVFTVSDGKAVAHAVPIGTRTADSVEVLAGLQPGMQIIAENLENIEQGTPVQVIRTIRAEDL